jgi:hypothetical protein
MECCLLALDCIRFLNFFFSVGSGLNEFDSNKRCVHIFRIGFPSITRYFESFYPFSRLEGIYIEIVECLVVPSRIRVYLTLKCRRKILLTQMWRESGYYSLSEVEYFSSYLAKFLEIPLKIQ